MMKGNRIENVIDSRSLEVNILANVSAVVSPAGLFLKFIFMFFMFIHKNFVALVFGDHSPDAVPYVLVGNVMNKE